MSIMIDFNQKQKYAVWMNLEFYHLLLWFLFGLGLLILAGDGFIKASVGIATIAKIPTLYIGTFLVGFATSIPELLVTYMAAQSGSVELAIGNVLGSYICNIGIILGISAMIKPLHISRDTLEHSIPLLTIAIVVTALLLIVDSQFNTLDGIALLVLFGGYITLCTRHITQNKQRFTSQNPVLQAETGHTKTYLLFAVYLVLLLIGSEIIVNSAVKIAEALQISPLVIGLTIVALGTSLPELTTSMHAIRHNEHDIAIGNIIGSNIFCLLCVLPIPLIMATENSISPEKLWVPLTMMLILTTALWLFSAKFDKKSKINRLEGACLLMITIIYYIVTGIS